MKILLKNILVGMLVLFAGRMNNLNAQGCCGNMAGSNQINASKPNVTQQMKLSPSEQVEQEFELRHDPQTKLKEALRHIQEQFTALNTWQPDYEDELSKLLYQLDVLLPQAHGDFEEEVYAAIRAVEKAYDKAGEKNLW